MTTRTAEEAGFLIRDNMDLFVGIDRYLGEIKNAAFLALCIAAAEWDPHEVSSFRVYARERMTEVVQKAISKVKKKS